jgi:hypothetical protein
VVAIRADTEITVHILHNLFKNIWEEEKIPEEWKEGILIKLSKKRDLRDCNNYCGIMLLSVPSKVFNRILLERLKEAVDQQTGFRQNRSCADQIASLRIIIEQSIEWKSLLNVNIKGYKKVFFFDWDTLWRILRHYGIPKKLVSLLQHLLRHD